MINAKYLSFERCEALFATARNKANGKPVPGVTGMRLFKHYDEMFTVKRYGLPMAFVADTDIVTLLETPLYFTHHAYQRLFGLTSWRIGVSKARIWSVETHGGNRGSNEQFKAHPIFFCGMEYDLKERKFLNAKPDPVRKRNAEADIAWRRKMSEYSKIWTVSAKCGAFDWIKAHANYEYNLTHVGADELVGIVNRQDFSEDAVKRIVLPCCWRELRWTPNRVDESVATAFKRTYAARREEIRKNLGCIAYE